MKNKCLLFAQFWEIRYCESRKIYPALADICHTYKDKDIATEHIKNLSKLTTKCNIELRFTSTDYQKKNIKNAEAFWEDMFFV